jgi:hypothetical protein
LIKYRQKLLPVEHINKRQFTINYLFKHLNLFNRVKKSIQNNKILAELSSEYANNASIVSVICPVLTCQSRRVSLIFYCIKILIIILDKLGR